MNNKSIYHHIDVEVKLNLEALSAMCAAGIKEMERYNELPPQTYKDIKLYARLVVAWQERKS